MPFRHRLCNYTEISNELTTLLMAVWTQSFINPTWANNIHYEYGWAYMVMWVTLAVLNGLVMLYFSFFLNIRMGYFYYEMVQKARNHESMLQEDVDFKGRFAEANPENFMMQYEAVSSSEFMVGAKDEHGLKHEYEQKKREIEWLKKHGIDPELVYPDWTPEKTKQMYRLGKRKPKPKPPAPVIEEIIEEEVEESEVEPEPPKIELVEVKSKPMSPKTIKPEPEEH